MYHQIIVIININIFYSILYYTTLIISLGTNTYFFFFNQYTSIRDYIWTALPRRRIKVHTTDTFLSNIGKKEEQISSYNVLFYLVSFVFPFSFYSVFRMCHESGFSAKRATISINRTRSIRFDSHLVENNIQYNKFFSIALRILWMTKSSRHNYKYQLLAERAVNIIASRIRGGRGKYVVRKTELGPREYVAIKIWEVDYI